MIMAMFDEQSFWSTISNLSLGAAFGAVATAVGAFFRSHESMGKLIDAKLKTLIEGYEARITDLQNEINRLEGKIDQLSRDLHVERLRVR